MTTMWILGAVFAVVGLPFIWISRRAFARDRMIAGWPRTDGVVTSARLKSSRHRYRERTGLDTYRTLYTPSVSYTYSVNGQSLEGSGIARSIDGMSTTERSAQAILDRYPVQQQVSVLYDPADSKVSFLEVRRSTGAVVLLVFGSFWIALGAVLVGLSFI